jgi:alpha-amylase/alpha-mannosidase (GH57 family)
MRRFACIHGHFYQPPRENPWLEAIETQDSAAPFHDWNDRITDECYGPNAAARILDFDANIQTIQNNYSKISFNFGPTLLSWLETHRPSTYLSILEADAISQRRFHGHGSAIAQVYNHIIMPLATKRDKETQIEWGLRDFEHRFKRKAEGIWLAETAVDLETLELLVDAEVKFTILAPRQASKIRRLNEEHWADVSDSRIDPRRAYLCKLPSGRSITLFFYDGHVAQDVAFSGLLKNGETFANRLLQSMDSDPGEAQLAHIATDGESYGHHHRFGEMALAYALIHLEKQSDTQLTIYGEYLEFHPPAFEVEIFENSSWSCVHGVERWKSDCGCCTGGNGDWNQKWRKPLREGLNVLRNRLGEIYESESLAYFQDPWETRNRSIKIHLGKTSPADFVKAESIRPLHSNEIQKAIKLLEIQRQSLLMFTSCGWFFDEISGIEPVQILQYASRAIQLAKELTGESLEPELLKSLVLAPSNIPALKNGEQIYQLHVKPSLLNFHVIAAHLVTHETMEKRLPEKWFIYEATAKTLLKKSISKTEFRFGRILLKSTLTQETFDFIYTLVHLGDHNLTVGVAEYTTDAHYKKLESQWKSASEQGDALQLIRNVDLEFSDHVYSLTSLLRDTQSLVLNHSLSGTFHEIEETFNSIYRQNHTLLNILQKSSFKTPPVITVTINLLFNAQLQKALEKKPFHYPTVLQILEEFMHWGPKLEEAKIKFLLRKRLSELLHQWNLQPEEPLFLTQALQHLEIVERLSLQIDFWEAQKWAFDFTINRFSEIPYESQELFKRLLKMLKVAPPSGTTLF